MTATATATATRYHQSANGMWNPCNARDDASCPLGGGLGHVDAGLAQHMNELTVANNRFRAELLDANDVSAEQLAALDAETPEYTYTEDFDAHEDLTDTEYAHLQGEDSSLFMSLHHTYKPANVFVEPETAYRASGWRGERYASGMTVAQINTALRRDIADAVKKGYLPKGLEYTVRQSGNPRGLGSVSVDITVTGVADRDAFDGGAQDEYTNNDSAAKRLLKRRLEDMSRAYGTGYIDQGSDYPFKYSHFTSVTVLDEADQKRATSRKALDLRKRESKKQAETLASEVRGGGFKKLTDRGFSFTHVSPRGHEVGRVPGTDLYIVGTASPIASGGYTLKAYDMAGYAPTNGRTIEEIFANVNTFAIDYKHGKRRFLG